jgi:hypothetical protein
VSSVNRWGKKHTEEYSRSVCEEISQRSRTSMRLP